MDETLSKPQSGIVNLVKSDTYLPWWTWLAPFLLTSCITVTAFSLGSGKGLVLWNLPAALGIVMIYWWGPRVLPGIFLGFLIPISISVHLPFHPLIYALVETIKIGLSWLLFIKLGKGFSWLPNLKHTTQFLFLGLFVPSFTTSIYLAPLFISTNIISNSSFWNTWQYLLAVDIASHCILTIPILILLSAGMARKGWALIPESISRPTLSHSRTFSVLDGVLLLGIFSMIPISHIWIPMQQSWVVFGFLLMILAIRYGAYIASAGAAIIGIFVFLEPEIMDISRSAISFESLGNDFGTLVLLGMSLLMGQAISELSAEVQKHKASEQEVRQNEQLLTQHADNLYTLSQISQQILTDLDLEQIYKDTHSAVQKLMPCDSFVVALVDEPNNEIEDVYLWDDGKRWPNSRYPIGQNLADFIISTGKPLRVNHWDEIHDQMTRTDTFGNPEKDTFSVLAIPLQDKHSTCFGMISAQSYEINAYTPEHEQLLITLTNQVARAIENTKLFTELQKELDERKQIELELSSREKFLAVLNDMTFTILVANNFSTTIERLAFDLKKIINADDCYILNWDEENQRPIPVATTAKLDFDYSKIQISEEDESLTAQILSTGKVTAVEDIRTSPLIDPDFAARYPARSVMGIPLIAGDQKLGIAFIAFNEPHVFTNEEIKRAEQAGNQIAIALWDFQQGTELERRLKENTALGEIGRELSETEKGGTDRVLQLIVDSALELIEHAGESVIHIMDSEEQVLVSRAISGFSFKEKPHHPPRLKLGEGVAGHVMKTGSTVNLGDITKSDLFIIKEGDSYSFRSLMVAPIKREGREIGTISVQSKIANAFSNRDVELLNALSVQATIAIENTRLFELTQQGLKEVNALYRISQGLVSSLDTDELLDDVVALLYENFGYYHVQIYLLDNTENRLVLKSASGEIGNKLMDGEYQIPLGLGILGHVLETGISFVSKNVADVVFYSPNPFLPDTQSELAVPVIMENQVVGVLDVQQAYPQRLTEYDLQLIEVVADQLSVALQKAKLYSNLQTALRHEQAVRTQLIQSERLALVGHLLASVSHELNNPLQAIQNALFLIKDEEKLSQQGKQDLDVILAEAERMGALIERLRGSYSPGKASEFKAVNINDIIEEVLTLISTHLRQNEIAFEFHPAQRLPKVPAITDQIHQVLLNLFINAIEVMNPGGRIIVRTRSLPRRKEIVITVKDTGPGIDPKILPRIFDVFITAKSSGTGLGLSITRDIVEKHHGRIEAKNDPQGGAVFHVWLPMDGTKGKS